MQEIYPFDAESSKKNISAEQAWQLFKEKSVYALGVEPYYFRLSRFDDVVCEFVGRWNDGYDLDDGTTYEDTEHCQSSFLETFARQYPQGVPLEWAWKEKGRR